jgi:hypothetical protein
MDWNNVTPAELWNALREVDLLRPPRPVWEFCSGFSIPKNQAKWTSRLKCNGRRARRRHARRACVGRPRVRSRVRSCSSAAAACALPHHLIAASLSLQHPPTIAAASVLLHNQLPLDGRHLLRFLPDSAAPGVGGRGGGVVSAASVERPICSSFQVSAAVLDIAWDWSHRFGVTTALRSSK